MRYATIALFFLFILLESCSGEKAPESGKDSGLSETPNETRTRLVVNMDKLHLRKDPGPEGAVIAELKQGDVLYDLGEVSDFTTRIELRGIQFDEPWIKVENEAGEMGWIYGGAINFTMENPTRLASWLMDKRLNAIFGPETAGRMERFRWGFSNITSQEKFADVYRAGNGLRDSLVETLVEKIVVMNTDELPDLFWLQQAIPGFQPMLVAEGTQYYLFNDYRSWRQKAARTEGKLDDEFVDLMIDAYPEDSIEYFFPAWQIQTWDYGGHSLLGRGIHYNILKKAAALSRKTNLFDPELTGLKKKIMDDMTEAHVSYWEPAAQAAQELDSIMQAEIPILSPQDKVALEIRREQFEAPEKYGIEFNKQSGM